MPDGANRTTIEVHLPLAMMERIRALESKPERTAESIVEESLQAYFAKRVLVQKT